MDTPLLISSVVRHGESVHRDAEVVTLTADGTRRATFDVVGRRAAQLAHGLCSLGITGDQRVATFMWNNQEHMEATLAVPAMGAVLHTLNIRLFPEQLVYIVNHAEDQVVILDGSLVGLFAPQVASCTCHTIVVTGADTDLTPLEGHGKTVLRYEELLAGQPTTFDWPEDLDERSAAAMCYTSGTTGDPKGVVYSHRSQLLHSFAMMAGTGLGMAYHDRLLPIVPMFHANAWGLPYSCFVAGTTMLMPDRFLQPEPLVRLIETERPTLAGAVPTIWNDVLLWLRANPGHDISSLRKVVCGGSAVPRSLMEAYRDELGVDIVQAWGMTETSPLATTGEPPAGLTGDAAMDYKVLQGRILFGVEARLVEDDGTVVPSDGKAVGEVQVRGPWVTAGYYGGPTGELIGADRNDRGWLRTGDVGTIDERGYLSLTDRAKDVIKSGGEWISSVELENTIIAHPDVVEAAVVGVPDERWQERPLAAVVLAQGAAIDARALCDWLAERTVKWWLPERWTFLDAVPRTSVGKYDKKVIRRRYADGELDVVTLGPES
jgi:fatty-acyl-CoA synthase